MIPRSMDRQRTPARSERSDSDQLPRRAEGTRSRCQGPSVRRFPAHLRLGETTIVWLPRREVYRAGFDDRGQNGCDSAGVGMRVDLLPRTDYPERSLYLSKIRKLFGGYERWRLGLNRRALGAKNDARRKEFAPHCVEEREIFPDGEGRLRSRHGEHE